MLHNCAGRVPIYVHPSLYRLLKVLEDDFVVFFSTFGSYLSVGVFLLVGPSLDAIVNLDFAGDRDRLLVVDVAVKTFEFRIAAVHAPSTFGGWGRSWMPRNGQF